MICKFVVTEKGNIIDVEVLQGIDAKLNDEVVRIIYSMPQWRLGKKNGQMVSSEYFLPIHCRIK
ncbi:energy transducer TonB [Bacteroides togonis]|uniref:energy transducer TonB n=1 Tax=Bacteroides togonis TaxID=1917883 RepID=UPI0009F9F84E